MTICAEHSLPCFLCKYWILGIVSQTLHIIEELSEIQCCYFGTVEELATLFPTGQFSQMVIPSKVGLDGFYSIAESCIIFEFLAAHLSLDFCAFMRCFGCNNFSNLFMNLRSALILVWTAGTVVAQERNSALAALLHIRTAFRRIACRALQNLCPFFIKFKICADVRGCLFRQTCCGQFYIFISCKWISCRRLLLCGACVFIFNNRLFRQTSDKQIILCGIMIVRSTQGKKAVVIR